MSPGARVLITGGSGFIGRHLVADCLASHDEVLNLDVRPPVDESQYAVWRGCDISDRGRLTNIVTEFCPDAVINLAAVADISLPADKLRFNVQSVENLIESLRHLPMPARLVQVSTQLVVGPGHFPTGSRDYRPYTPYGESKAESEAVLWTKGAGIPWVIARPTNVWGPGHPTFGTSTWKYIARRVYLIPRDRAVIRSFGYVKNVARQLRRLALKVSTEREVFYVADHCIDLAEWVDAFAIRLTGMPARRASVRTLRIGAEVGELLKRIRGFAPFDRGRFMRITTSYPVPLERTLATLGVGPVELQQGVDETVEWLEVTFPEWYQRAHPGRDA